ncbi:MAG TPA: DUF2066 domain-containing protein [Gammaproteobacteria bacterium]|nr:DUF2066 domain-containing protein [Gammaproteobacteria bacterium]
MPLSAYQGQVAVASHSPADWNKAVAPALLQVLVRMSGNPNIGDSDRVKQGLAKADAYVQSYNYVTDSRSGSLSLQIRFSPKAVDNLLQNVNQAYQAPPTQMATSQNRSLTLVWLAVQDAQGQPQILTDSKDATVANVQQQADKAGLSLLWPAGDLQDVSSVSASQVWQLDQGAVQQASQRYRADNILLGKIQKQPDGSSQGSWVLLSNQGNVSWQTQGNNANQAAAAVLTKLAGITTATNTAEPAMPASGQVSLTVIGINGLKDYAALVNYLRNLTSVMGVDTTRMAGDSVMLAVSLRAAQSAFVNEINQGGQLTALNSQNQGGLTYQWAGAGNATTVLSSASTQAPVSVGNAPQSNVQSYSVPDTPTQFTPDTNNVVPDEVSP